MQHLTETEARVRVAALAADPPLRPYLVGIVGAPGVGKSTFAESLGRPILPMDGYHYADEHLDRLGRRARKGAPDTFDTAGYVRDLARLRAGEAIVAPRFHREIEAAIAGSIPLSPAEGVILTEGNYLLLDEGDWGRVRALLDEVWYLAVDDEVRRARLVARHILFGRSADDARAWVESVDEPNARLIAASADRADAIITLS